MTGCPIASPWGWAMGCILRAQILSYVSPHSFITILYRDHFVYGLSQWETTLQCDVISHWLCPHHVWSLFFTLHELYKTMSLKIMVICLRWSHFLSLAQSKLRLCSANHRSGYWSNLPCDWPSTAWAYSEQETENGPRWHTIACTSAHQDPMRQATSLAWKLSKYIHILKVLVFISGQFLHNTHNRQHINYLWRQNIGCLLWVFKRKMQGLTYQKKIICQTSRLVHFLNLLIKNITENFAQIHLSNC